MPTDHRVKLATIKRFDQLIAYLRDEMGWPIANGSAFEELKSVDVSKRVIATNYRPFDSRWIFFDSTLVWGRSWPTMQHVVGHRNNLTLLATRMTKDQWDTWVARTVSSHKAMSAYDTNSVFPLFLVEDAEAAQRRLSSETGLNLSALCLRALSERLDLRQQGPMQLPEGVTPEDIFHYAYAVFRSPGYRSRYEEFLDSDFPRLPLTGSRDLFRALARLGGELVALHLLESHKLDRLLIEYLGGRAPEVEKVSWSRNTVWLDKAQTNGFKGVRDEVWNFHVGGYQVCEKWLKDRRGRTLSRHEIAHYQKIVVALAETIHLMKEIDEVIEQYGGWPAAFQAGQAKAAAKVVPFRPPSFEPRPEDQYKTCVPLFSIEAAAGAFGDPQQIDNSAFEWVAVTSRHHLRQGMFVVKVVGRSMEPTIPDESYCLFRVPLEGTRQGKIVLVELRDSTDPETGHRYTVKRYVRQEPRAGESTDRTILLKPANQDFEPIVIASGDDADVRVVAEFLEVLSADS